MKRARVILVAMAVATSGLAVGAVQPQSAGATVGFTGGVHQVVRCLNDPLFREVNFSLSIDHEGPGGSFTVGVSNLSTPDAFGTTTDLLLRIDGPVDAPVTASFPGSQTVTTTGPGVVTVEFMTLRGYLAIGTNHYPYTCTPALDGVEASPIVASVPLDATIGASSNTDVTVEEGVGAAVTVALSAPAAAPLSVEVVPQGGSATSGTDFDPTSAVAMFQTGETAATVSINTTDDDLAEGDKPELVVASLANPTTPLALIGNGQVRVTDNEPYVYASAPTVVEGDDGETKVYVTVTLSEPAPTTRQLTLATNPASALVGYDYIWNPATLTFKPGVRQRTVTVRIASDALAEPDEYFVAEIESASGFKRCQVQTRVTITDPAPAPNSVWIGDTNVLEGDAGSRLAKFAVTLSQTPTSTVTVKWSTTDGSASAAGGDYTTRTGRTLTFRPGQRSKVISVPVVPDLDDEGNETFGVVLSSPIGTAIGDGNATATILEDIGYCAEP